MRLFWLKPDDRSSKSNVPSRNARAQNGKPEGVKRSERTAAEPRARIRASAKPYELRLYRSIFFEDSELSVAVGLPQTAIPHSLQDALGPDGGLHRFPVILHHVACRASARGDQRKKRKHVAEAHAEQKCMHPPSRLCYLKN